MKLNIDEQHEDIIRIKVINEWVEEKQRLLRKWRHIHTEKCGLNELIPCQYGDLHNERSQEGKFILND